MIAIMDILKSARVVINRIQPELANADLPLVQIDIAALTIFVVDSLNHVLKTLVAVYGQATKRMHKTKRLTLDRPLVFVRATRRAINRSSFQPAIQSLSSVRGS